MLHLISRTTIPKPTFINWNPIMVKLMTPDSNNSRSNSDSSSENDSGKESQKKEKQTNNETLNKLNLLLKQMVEEDVVSGKSAINLAKPKNKRRKLLNEQTKDDSIKLKSYEKQIVSATKDVATSLGGDVKQTESRLLTKLLNPLNDEGASNNLSDIMRDMKIEREVNASEQVSRAQQVRLLLQRANVNQGQENLSKVQLIRKRVTQLVDTEIIMENINLFGEKSLNILTGVGDDALDEEVVNKTWETLYNRELRLAVTHPPADYLQQMILWTEQGKLWKFPIDNEQGMEDEQNIYFTEHIFLEKHLELWCPQKGPIRHFMELVCVGLSKNPYLSVKHKKEHIEWFRNYFEDKKQLLKEVGAITSGDSLIGPKYIDS